MEIYCFILLLCIVGLREFSGITAAEPELEGEVETACLDVESKSADRNESFTFQFAPNNKPLVGQKTELINLLHDPLGYGYLGDLCVPGYNLTKSGHCPSVSGKWRVVCRAGSSIFVVVLGMDMPEGDYLQMRRRAFSGRTARFHGVSLKKNSVLFGNVRASESQQVNSLAPFRLAYICARSEKSTIAAQIFLNRATLDYMQTQKSGIEKAVLIVQDHVAASFSQDPVVRKILSLSATKL